MGHNTGPFVKLIGSFLACCLTAMREYVYHVDYWTAT